MEILNDGKIRQCIARVESNSQLAENTFALNLKECFLDLIKPGQFVALAPLNPQSAMCRPFSVYSYDPFAKLLSILYRKVGSNTELMAKLQPGQEVKLWGPLGNGLNPEDIAPREIWLVGGGIGLAPIYYCCSRFEDYNCRLKLFYGVKTKKDLLEFFHYDYQDFNIQIAIEELATGQEMQLTEEIIGPVNPGLITDVFKQDFQESTDKNILVITCGPKAMMKKVAELCAGCGTECYVILERIMACGIGDCLGCSIKMQSGEMKRICHDGPVFNAKEVDWNALS